MAKPIWIFGPNRGQPNLLAWLINGSPDCCPELSNVYDKDYGKHHRHEDWWDEIDEEGERFTLGRPKFWQPLEWADDPIYTKIATSEWYRTSSIEMTQMLKNKPKMLGPKEEFLYYAECADKLPGKYHAMVVRVTNLEDALEWVPGSKALLSTCICVPSITEVYAYFCGDFALTKAHENDKGAIEEITRMRPLISWPLETGNSPNGYIPDNVVYQMALRLKLDIISASGLVQRYNKNQKIICFDFHDFMIVNNTPNIYDNLGLAKPTTEWINTWVERFRSKAKLDSPGNPDLQKVIDFATNFLNTDVQYQEFLAKRG